MISRFVLTRLKTSKLYFKTTAGILKITNQIPVSRIPWFEVRGNVKIFYFCLNSFYKLFIPVLCLLPELQLLLFISVYSVILAALGHTETWFLASGPMIHCALSIGFGLSLSGA
jgi:hypothetical protein